MISIIIMILMIATCFKKDGIRASKDWENCKMLKKKTKHKKVPRWQAAVWSRRNPRKAELFFASEDVKHMIV